MADIDRNSPLPIYHQLKTLIREQIENGVWGPGERIPTEQELCQLYDISRSPVRQALNELAYDGLLIRRPGLGTFVNAHASIDASPDAPIQVMSSDSSWSRVLDQVAGVWNAEHSSQKVTFHVDVVDHSQFYRLLSSAVGSGTAPDVAMVDGVWVAGLAQSDFLYAFEDLDAEWNQGEFVEDLYPAFIEANSFAGRLYGLPLKADASLLWYRQDWFAQEGLEPPHDWDGLLEVARHFLKPQAQERYGLTAPLAFPAGTAGGEATVYSLMPFIWSAGGEIFDAEAGYVVLDAPGTRRALQFLQELVTLHRVSPPDVVNFRWGTSPWLFATGKVAMVLGGSYESRIIRDASGWGDGEFMQRVGCAPPPAAPGGAPGSGPVSTVGGTSYVILRQCQRPAQVMDVLRFAIRPDVVGNLYCSLLQNSPCRSFSACLSPEAKPLLTQVSRMIASGRARPSIPGYFRVSRQLQAMFEAAISDHAPVDEVVRRAAEFIGVIC